MHSFANYIFNKAHIFRLQKALQLAFVLFFLISFQNGKAQCPNATPIAATTVCSGTIISVLLTSDQPGTTYTWTAVQTDVVGASSCSSGCGSTIADTLTAAEAYAGTVVYTVTPFTAGCPAGGTPIFVTITVNPIPLAIAANTIICSGATSSVAITSDVAGTTFAWTVIQAGVTGASSGAGNLIAQTLSTTGPSVGIATYNIIPTADGCVGEPINTKVTVRQLPSLTLGANPQVCQGTTAANLTYSSPGGGPNQYSINYDTTAEGQGFVDVPNTVLPASPIGLVVPAAAAVGVYNAVLTVNNTNNGCPGASYPITVRLTAATTVADAGPDQTICGADSTTLAANSAITGTGTWTVFSGVGGSFADSSVYNTIFSGTAGTTYVLVWTISNTPCPPSASTVTIAFNQLPTPANAGPDQTICGSNSTFLAADTALIGTGNWSVVAGVGGSFLDSTDNNTVFAGIIGNTYTLLWAITNDSCASADSVTITFNQAPTPANAGPDQVICGADSVTLAANAPALGTGNWSVSSGGVGVFADPTDSATVFTGTIGNTYVLVWTITNDSCASADSVTVDFNLAPTPANAGPDQTICGSDSAFLAANEPLIGTGSWSVASGAGGSFADTNDSASIFHGVVGTSYVLVWTITNDACVSPDSVTITFSSKPLLVTVGQSICLPDSTIDIAQPGVTAGSTPSMTFTYFTDPGATSGYNTPNAATAATYYIVGTLGGTCSDTAGVTVTLNPGAVVNTNNQWACSPSTVDLTIAAVTQGSSFGLTFSYFTDSTATIHVPDSTAVGTGVYYIVGQSVFGCKDTTSVTVTIRLTPTVATIPQNACSPDLVDLRDSLVTLGSTAGLAFSYYTDSGATTAYNIPCCTPTGIYYIVGTDGLCADTTAVTVTINPKPTVLTAPTAAVCAPATIDLTLPAVTAGSTDSLTFTYFTNSIATIHTADSTAITTSGLYYIVGTTSKGCSDTTAVFVTITPKPVIIAVNQVRCAPATVNLSAAAVTFGSTPGLTFTYFTNPAFASIGFPAYTTVGAGNYYIVGTTAGGCKDTAAVTVTINPSPIVLTTAPPAACFPPATVDLTDPSVTVGSTVPLAYTYFINAGATIHTTDSTAVSAGGTYYIVGTNGFGCSDTTPVTVTIFPTPSVVTVPLALCDSLTVDLTDPAVTFGSTPGLTFTYYIDFPPTIHVPDSTAVGAGTYYIVGTTPDGCSNIAAVAVDTLPTVTTAPIDQCDPDTTTNLYFGIDFGNTTPGLTFTYYSDSLGTMIPILGADTATAPEGDYYIVGTTPSGCADTTPVTFTVHDLPVVLVTNQEVCAPGTVDLSAPAVTVGSSGVSSFTYYTNPGFVFIGSPAYSMVGAGDYNIVGISAFGCRDTGLVNVIIDIQPSLITHNQAVCSPISTIDLTDSIITWGSDTALTYTYFINAIATTHVADSTAVGPGNYWIVGTAVGGCSDTTAVTFTVNTKPIVNTNPQSICAPGTINLTLPAVTAGSIGPISGFTYLDSTNTPIPPPTAISVSGTYNIVGTTAAGCSDTASVLVTINSKPDLVTTSPIVCAPATKANLTLPAVTALSSADLVPPGIPFTYFTDPGAISSYSTPAAAIAGTYYIVGVTAAGCRDTTPVTFTANPKPFLNTVPQSLCWPDTTFDLTLASATAGSDSGLTLNYYSDLGATTLFADSTAARAGTYWLVGIAASGCSDTAAINISVNAKPTVFINNPAPICSSGTADLTLPAVTQGSTASLSLSYYTDSLATIHVLDSTAVGAGTYYIVGVTLAGCSDTSAVIVTVNSNSSLDSVSGTPTLCLSDTTTYIAYGVVLGGGIGSWSSNDTLVATVDATGLVTGIGVGNCDIIFTITGGCSGIQKDSANITVNPLPTVGFTASPNDSVCFGDTVALSGTGAISYLWSGGITNGVPFLATNASYTVTGTDAFGCSDTAAATITVNPLPTIGFTALPNDSICLGSSVTLSGNGGTSYLWTGGVINGAGFSPVATGSYTVTGTDAFGCTDTSVVTITVNLPDSATFFYPLLTYCASDPSNPTPTVTGLSGGTFSSTPGLVFISTVTGQINLASSTIGTDTITYTTNGPCPNSSTFIVTITNGFSATFTYDSIAYCQGASPNPNPTFPLGSSAGIFSATPAGLAFVDTTTGQINLTLSLPGTYTVKDSIPASGGCIAATSTSTLTITALPVATFSYSDTSYCQNASNPLPTFSGGGVAGVFSSTPGLVFVNTATGLINLALTTPGTYTVTNTVAPSGGCAAVNATFDITITALPIATFSYAGTPYCQNAANPMPTFPPGASSGIFSAVPAGLVFVSNLTGQVDLAASTPGVYTIKDSIVAVGGCPAVVATSQITINALDDPSFSYASSTYCSSDPINPTPIVTGLAGGTFGSTTGLVFISMATGQINLAASAIGTDTITYTTNGLCPNSSTFIVTITNGFLATFSYDSIAYCQGESPNPSPVFPAGASAGVFSALPAGLVFVNVITGEIDLAASAAGLYTVKNFIAAAGSCLADSAITSVTIDPLDDASFSYSLSTYCQTGTNDTAIITGLPGGTFTALPAGLVFLDDSTGLIDLAASAANTYTITYTTNGPCTNTATYTLTITLSPSALFSYSGAYCQGGSPNPLPTFPLGSSAGTFSAIPAGLVFVNANTGQIDITASASGTFSVKNVIAASAGCPADSSTNTVTINPVPTIAVAGPDQTNAATCGLTSVTLAANSALIGTGVWTEFSGDGLGVFADSTDPATVFSGTAGITYVLWWTISNAPCTASIDIVTITFNQAPSTAVAGPDQTSSATCGLTSVTLAANLATIGVGNWSVFSGGGGSFADATDPATVFSGIPDSTYVLIWTITNICGNSTDSVTIKFNQAPTTAVAGFDQTGSSTCGLTSVTLAANSPTIGTGNWSIFSGGGGSFVDASDPTAVFSGTAGSTYVLIWTITNAPCASTDSITITFNLIPTLVTNAPLAVCSPATVDLTLPAVTATSTAGLNYSYFTDAAATTHIADSTAVAISGTYYIVGLTLAGCSDTTAVVVTVNSTPVLTVTGINLTCFNICNGNAIATVAGGNPLYRYAWSSGISDTIAATVDTLKALCIGGYTVTVTDGNGCADTDSITLTQPTQIVPNITTGNISCFGVCDGLSESSPTGGTAPYTFQWNTGSVDTLITNLCPGTYTVIVTDALGCTNSLPDTIVQAATVLSNAIITNATCGLCDGQVVLVPSGGIAPYTFLWGTGQTTDTITNLCGGLYSVNIMDSAGCSSSYSIPISNPGGPTSATITSTNISCFGLSDGTVTAVTPLGGTPPYSYLWIQGGQTTSTLSGLVAGVYYVQIADSVGCSLVDSVIITEPTQVVVNQFITAATCGAVPCDGGLSVAPSGGAAPYSVLWSNGSTSDTLIGLCADFYSVQITDALGCSQNIAMPLNNLTAPTLTTSSVSLLCSSACNATATVVAAGGSTPYAYLWSDPGAQTTDVATALCAGTYFVQVTGGGCVSFASVTITDPAPIGFSLANSIDPLCNGNNNGSLAVIPFGGTLPYTFSWTGSGSVSDTASGLSAGVYIVTVTDANGCSSSQTNTLVGPPSLTISNVPTPASCNTFADGAIDVTVGGGTPGYTYQWSGGSSLTTQDLTNVLTGTYAITVTDTNGCSISDNITVTSTVTVLGVAGNDTALCEPATMLLSAVGSTANVINYQWFELPANTLVGSAVNVTVTPPVGATDYYVIVDNGAGCAHSDTITVTVNPLPVANAGADVTILANASTVIGGNPTGPAGASYSWLPVTGLDNATNANPVAEPTVTTTYTVTVTSAEGCISSDIIVVTVVANITFGNGISPNADGANDEWIIDNIELFPKSLVEIYNRWGELLFQSVGYTERWKGIFKGQLLPVGTYYYIINLNDPLFPDAYTGPITILR